VKKLELVGGGCGKGAVNNGLVGVRHECLFRKSLFDVLAGGVSCGRGRYRGSVHLIRGGMGDDGNRFIGVRQRHLFRNSVFDMLAGGLLNGRARYTGSVHLV
jgi:hypothetical protein